MDRCCKVVAVIGSANSDLSQELKNLSVDIGCLLVDSGFLLVNGGMGGVMRYSAEGARSSSKYQFGCIIGILPSYQKGDANEYIDIAIPTGLGVARNTMVVAAADIVVALDGGAGTLSELAMAWQMGKHIVCVGGRGWHTRLTSLRLDQRREECIHVAENIDELKSVLLCFSEPKPFGGIQRSK